MPCYHPLRGYRSKTVNPSGKRSIVFNVNDGFRDLPVDLPCGQCIGCRLDRTRDWAIRCHHEAQVHTDNCFLTLTYSPENLPHDWNLRKDDFPLFMKRLRSRYPGRDMSYLMCGEYGERYARPHYHALLFGFDFGDKVELCRLRDDEVLYKSRTLEDIWGLGFCTIGSVTWKSAAYVARYVTKKVTGKLASEFYERVREDTGEVIPVVPEYGASSKKHPIGKRWLEKYKTDVFPDDFVVIDGKKLKVPKFYSSFLSESDPQEGLLLKVLRKASAAEHSDNNSFERLRTREELHLLKARRLTRGYENGS